MHATMTGASEGNLPLPNTGQPTARHTGYRKTNLSKCLWMIGLSTLSAAQSGVRLPGQQTRVFSEITSGTTLVGRIRGRATNTSIVTARSRSSDVAKQVAATHAHIKACYPDRPARTGQTIRSISGYPRLTIRYWILPSAGSRRFRRGAASWRRYEEGA